jgi:uncharacterized protein YbbK (DUF523 family)
MTLITPEAINNLPDFTPENLARILVSACLMGKLVGVDGTSNGEYPWIPKLLSLPNVKPVLFCPEDFAFGTPRGLPDIHGGNGYDVLDGKAKVLNDKGDDWTNGMVEAARRMLKIAQEKKVHIAILMDMSAACGSQVISDGCRLTENRKYQKGPGVAAALLMRSGISVISQRDFRTLEYLHRKLDKNHTIDEAARDHHETDWYRTYFQSGHS